MQAPHEQESATHMAPISMETCMKETKFPGVI